MIANDDKYFECPTCGFVITFHLQGDKYVSYCPYCKNRLEMDKEEYEKEDTEYYFKPDF